jgi:hypothetical protein
MVATESDIFNEESFWPTFLNDLKYANTSVIISCPFVRRWRLGRLAPEIKELVRKGCSVCVFIQTPSSIRKEKGTLSPDEETELYNFERDIEIIESWSVHLTKRPKTHQKFAIIDGRKLWEGSLNILSHRDSVEHMRRFESVFEAQRIIRFHDLGSCEVCAALKARYFVSAPDAALQVQMLSRLIQNNRKARNLSLRRLGIASGVAFQRIAQMEKTMHMSALIPVLQVLNALDLRMVICQNDDLTGLLKAVDLKDSMLGSGGLDA